ncbi:YfcC family protein [Streptococcus zalophi]|uniref:YfcC family protein n=1 Tax=Streptococcus zalophi TaxID=640031 RepID=A0A934PA31_9STRE|nr:YfcC family protein [Streptococcus zalophi]MBJ8349854.1 YfcC family protein [Streptococcus zalophi]MCR8967621.1 YfcC family protein [Streptococcus zalophi]
MTEKVKKAFKMPSSYTVLILIIAFMAILTWIIPAGQYQVSEETGNLIAGTYETVEQNPQGFYEVLMAPVVGMIGNSITSGAIEVSFFILMVGAFLGVVTETGALDVGIASLVKNFKGKEKMLIPVLMILFALGGSTYGMGEETMAFYPLLIPVMLAVGFDTITAVSIILIGSQVGCLASTVNPFATGVASDAAGVSIADGAIWRVVFFVVILAVSIFYVYNYASKIEKDPSKSYVYAQREENLKHFKPADVQSELTKSQRKTLWIFVITFLIMILSLIPWSGFGIHIFEAINDFLTGLPVFGQFFGHSLPLGDWYFQEITMLFIFMAVFVGIVSKMGEDKFFKAFLNGAADLLGVALICAVARGIQVVMNDGQITATILHWGEEGLKGLSSQVFIVLTYIFYLPMSFLIPSTSGLAGATMGILGPLGEFAKVPTHLIITAFQAASGVLNLITPTSGIVMGGLALGRVDITTWWKYIGKLIAAIVVLSMLILVVATFF